jgi:hypothetical protein
VRTIRYESPTNAGVLGPAWAWCTEVQTLRDAPFGGTVAVPPAQRGASWQARCVSNVSGMPASSSFVVVVTIAAIDAVDGHSELSVCGDVAFISAPRSCDPPLIVAFAMHHMSLVVGLSVSMSAMSMHCLTAPPCRDFSDDASSRLGRLA